MPRLSAAKCLQLGLRAARTQICGQDKIWSRYSDDKVDIARTLSRTIRTLSKALPLQSRLMALSIGSSNEPQFRILESAFRDGLFLLDIDEDALAIIEERIVRQKTDHVATIRGDYRAMLGGESRARRFRTRHLRGRRMSLVTFHHSLYYAPQSSWLELVAGIYRHLLAPSRGGAPGAAIHAVLMASHCSDPTSTTWLYNHFAGKFFGRRNDQDLRRLARQLSGDPRFADAQVLTKSSRVTFYVDDFQQFMGVIWMVMLHPTVHRLSRDQQAEITDFVYHSLWRPGLPLVQQQDHLVVYRGRGMRGLV